jgi:hypothetical protein
MDYKRIQIDSIGIGLNDITSLDLTKNDLIKTYLAVGDLPNLNYNISQDDHKLNHIHNLIVTDKGVGINTYRSNVYLHPNNSLIISGNIKCSGSIHAENIILDNELSLNSNLATFNQVLNRISSHLLFYNVKDYLQDNIYTTHNVVIGNEDNANNNQSPLKISRHCNNNANNIQFIIQNNDITNDSEPTNISMGIIGNIDTSPAHILTSSNMPLHFNISKSKTDINELYKDFRETPIYTNTTYPSLTLDTNGSVIINKDKIANQITYNSYSYDTQITVESKTEYPKLFINGSVYADTILLYDYISKRPVNIDSIYVRQGDAGGLTLQAKQILGGNFNKAEFIFNSNVYIGNDTNHYKLNIYGDAEITNNLNTSNLTTSLLTINSNLEVNGNGYCHFNKPCTFYVETHFNNISCDEYISTKTLDITGSLLINGTNISLLGNTTIAGEIANSTVTNYLNVGGKTTGITDLNYNSEILNIYKFRDSQKQKFEILIKDTTITPYGSVAFIGHSPLNLLQNEIDNSLIILTQYNTSWNNIYFYAGKNKSTLKSTVPNLAIMENNKIGINTITPEKTLDIIGDIIASKYYLRSNSNYECKLPIIYNNYNNINNLNININETDIITNPQKLNIKGGINSYDGYYENNNKLCSIKYVNSSDAIIDNANIGIGTATNNQIITMSLQIKNNFKNNNKINNSVITFYRSLDNSKYSGIEFCDDSTNLSMVNKNKWYIYKNHITDDFNFTGPLQIGYMKNSYKPSSKSCINLYYDNSKYYVDINNPITYNSANEFNKNKEDVRIYGNVRISGDLELDGSINIKGNYKFNDNNILFSPNPVEKIITKIYSLGNNVYYFDTILSSNHPKNISFKNSNLTSFINTNIADDKLNLNVPLNITNSSLNYNISSNVHLLTSNLNLSIVNYSNINNIIDYYNDTLKTNIITNSTNSYNNYLSYTQQNSVSSGIIITTSDLLQGALTNKNYSYSNYLISSNIYQAIKNIKTKPISSFNSEAVINCNLSLININTISSSYVSITYNDDINIITKLSSNIFISSSNTVNNANNYNNLPNVSPFDESYLTSASNEMMAMSNIYLQNSNYFNTLSSISIQMSDYTNILSSNYQYSIINSNNIQLNSNKLLSYGANYSNLNYNIITPIKNISTINLNVSRSNLELASKIYKNLSLYNDRNYLDYAQIGHTIAINASNLNNNITTDTITYSNSINNYLTYSNIYSRYSYLRNYSNYSENNNTNYYIYHDGAGSTTPIIIKNNSQSNLNYSSNLYSISTDIYNTLNTIKTSIISPSLDVAINYSNIARTNYITANNSNIYFSNIYYDKSIVSDINNILNINQCNQTIASNIYINASNYANILNTIKTTISTDISNALNDYNYSSQVYKTCSNTYINKDSIVIDTLVFNNYINASNILIASSNITDKIVNNYAGLYNNITLSKDTYKSTSTDKIKSATSKLLSSISTNLQSYLDKSISNKTFASNLDYDISRFDPDYNEKLDYYQNLQEIGSGINKIKSFINSEKDVYITYKSNIINLFNDYIIEEYLIEAHNNLINAVDYCINLLIELDADAINLSDFLTQPALLLELILHITNKYINFINKSFDFANSASQVVATINDHIGIYIISSLSILPLLNTMSEYANTYLNRSWVVISRQIVLFASVSYSLNALIPSETPIPSQEGQNTDVLIIGNNIKLFPTKSLIVGHANDYSRWIENLDDQINPSTAYFYNYVPNSCSCSFNVKANKFISSTANALSLKTSSAIDINIVDTSITDYHNSMFDGVSLKLSHIYRRDNVNLVNATSNNSIFEIVRKQNLNNPYFSCYTNDIYNILNIGGGNFYDSNYNCIIQDAVVHINENTANHLLKLTNSSTNPTSIILCNNTNNWTLSANDKLNFIYNTNSIININSNGISINTNSNNATLTINSFNNIPSLELKNNYDISPLKTLNLTLKQTLIVDYDDNGITYSKNPNTDTYDISKTTFEVNCNITLEPINYVLSNVVVSYNNINELNPFIFTTVGTQYIVNLLPIINLNDPKLSYTINNYDTYNKTFNYLPYTITYITPTTLSVAEFSAASLTVNPGDPYDFLIETRMKHKNTLESDNVSIAIDYKIGTTRIRNIIIYNKYKSFQIETLNLTLTRYNYNLVRPTNTVPKSLYNGSHTNTITKTITFNNQITITNTLNYLKTFTPAITTHQYSFTETKLKNYPVGIFELIYDIPINITITDYYDLYFNKTDITDQTKIPLEYININQKKPQIKHVNIYNNSHNIYSYTDDYELYLNDNKLLNISSIGTLTTSGNIETNNLYLKGDIYNADGISLYDNILSLMNNISSTANLELHSKNIILNPGIGFNDYYRGGVLINGNNINEINNNIFQINNYDGNDNLLTLNSSSSNSFAHFVSKVNQIGSYNSIFRIGNSNGIFGIWKDLTSIPYNNNYFIDGMSAYQEALTISYVGSNFEIHTPGRVYELSDKRLKTDIKKIENALDKLLSLNGITYTMNNDEKRKTGLIAQEVKEVLPEAISTDTNGFYNISYGNLAGLIIEAIKELKSEIDIMKAKV